MFNSDIVVQANETEVTDGGMEECRMKINVGKTKVKIMNDEEDVRLETSKRQIEKEDSCRHFECILTKERISEQGIRSKIAMVKAT